MKRDFDIFVGKDSGRLCIGMSQWTSLFFVSKVLPIFIKNYPFVKIELMQQSVHQLEPALRSKKLDFCIEHTSFLDPNIVYDTLANERIFLFAPINSPIAQAHPTSFENPSHIDITLLADQPILSTEKEQVLYRIVKNMFSKYNIEPYFRISATSTFALVELTAAGLGFSFVPELGEYFQKYLNRIAVYTVDDPILSWPLYVAYRKDERLSVLAQDFIRITKTVLNQNNVFQELSFEN